MNKVAVITDSVSPGLYFPLWHKFYATNFGPENLYVVTYAGLSGSFRDFPLGGIWESDLYDDGKRCKIISSLLSVLLEHYSVVLRVDTDEILVPDPRHSPSLSDYIRGLDRPYVTAEGYDIIQDPSESGLDFNKTIPVSQRKYAYPYDALNKTCVTKIPMAWAPGFHFSSVFPEFFGLYLLHLKRADISIQLEIGRMVADKTAQDETKRYHLIPESDLTNYNNTVLNFKKGTGWNDFVRHEYRKKFLNEIRYTRSWGGIYHGGKFCVDQVLLELPLEFLDAF